MRAGACTVQQALTAEAASIVKQSVGLARRRGHAQVTPLHVANTMLSSPTGLLRSACLKSHSHPLQCKALELCFNVALNRLPATSSSVPMLGHHLSSHHQPPVLSNALVAAFKRAQAHQRRGLVESQQQPLLTVKIELEQLIISILDDPSVSRVMREAGFSSTQVKTNVEQAISADICIAKANPNSDKPKDPSTQSIKDKVLDSEDMISVLDTLAGRKKRSVVLVGESISTSEAAIRRLKDMVNKGEVPENLRSIQFITILLSTFVNMSIDEVQQRVAELRGQVRSSCFDRGAVMYLGDLNWTVEYWTSCGEKRRCSYCPIESVLREIAKLVFGGFVEEIGSGELWLLSTATYQAFMRCRVGNPSLEILLGLHPLTVPAGSFNLSLNYDSDSHSPVITGNRIQDGTFLGDGPKFLSEAHPSTAITGKRHDPISCKLPSWLKVFKEENKRENLNDQDSLQRKDQSSYWNFMGSPSNNYQLERTLSFSSTSPSSSSYYEQNTFSLFHTCHTWPMSAPTSRVCSPDHDEQRKPTIKPNSAPSSDTMEMEYVSRFKELSAQNLKVLCNVLEKEVRLHMDIIPDIASTILQCRSGILKRKEISLSPRKKEDTWLLFNGNDFEGKEKLARELAFVIFGSRTNFTLIELRTFSYRRFSSDEVQNKRLRSDTKQSFIEQFFVALRDNPHCVIMVDDVEEFDQDSQMFIKNAIERGKIQRLSGEEVTVGDAIIILSCKSIDYSSRGCSPSVKKKIGSDEDKEEECNEISSSICFDLNLSGEDDMQNGQVDDVGLLEVVDRAFLLNTA